MKKKRIYIDQWLVLKPYDNHCPTDRYYLQLSNDVRKALTSINKRLVLNSYLEAEEIDLLACFLTSYFEDLISETNLWNTFVKKHQQLYKKPLPFYNVDEYFEEEINTQDVCFLIWYFMNTLQMEKFISPFNEFIEEAANAVMAVLDDAWEYAPENEYLKSFYQIAENETDYYKARAITDIVLFQSYLFYTDAGLLIKKSELEIIENGDDDFNKTNASLNENRENNLNRTRTRLLSLKGKDWAAQIIGENHPLQKDFSAISQRISGIFLYKGQDDENVFIEHVASGKKFNLIKKSFDYSYELEEIDMMMFLGMVKWQNEWWFSGIFFDLKFNADIILNEKNSIESRRQVSFLDPTDKVDEVLSIQYKVFKEFNNGLSTAFVPSSQVNSFIENYQEYYNAYLKLSEKEKKAAKQRAKDEGYFGGDQQFKMFEEEKDSDSVMVFFNPKSGIEIATGVNSAFPLPNNPYFKKEESRDAILLILMNEEISTELAMYCIDNFKADLPFFTEGEGEVFLEDIDFLLRFWKKENYHTLPSISFIG